MNSQILALFIALTICGLFFTQSHQAVIGGGSRSSPCQILTDRIICSGSSITDASLLILKDELHLRYNHMYFVSLHITDTEVTKIHSGTFVDVQFEHIYIQDNKHLNYIAEDAFSKQNAHTLYIMNNPELKNNSAYRLADTLHVSEAAYFDFNGFVEVPSNAFNELIVSESFFQSKEVKSDVPHPNGVAPGIVLNPNINHSKKATFKKLVMNNNQIERIASNAFHLLQDCNEIDLNLNKLSHIATHGFNLEDHLGSATAPVDALHLRINLQQNLLTTESFESEFIHLNANTNVFVDLSKNQIKELKKDIFKPLIEKNIRFDFSSNPIDCSTAAWLKEDPKLLVKTMGVLC